MEGGGLYTLRPVTWWHSTMWCAKLGSFSLTNSCFLSEPLVARSWFLDYFVFAKKWDHSIWRTDHISSPGSSSKNVLPSLCLPISRAPLSPTWGKGCHLPIMLTPRPYHALIPCFPCNRSHLHCMIQPHRFQLGQRYILILFHSHTLLSHERETVTHETEKSHTQI